MRIEPCLQLLPHVAKNTKAAFSAAFVNEANLAGPTGLVFVQPSTAQ
jgi:hypothetical protein